MYTGICILVFFEIHFIYLFFVCLWVDVGGQRTACRMQISPTLWVPRIELRLSNRYLSIHWAVPLTL